MADTDRSALTADVARLRGPKSDREGIRDETNANAISSSDLDLQADRPESAEVTITRLRAELEAEKRRSGDLSRRTLDAERKFEGLFDFSRDGVAVTDLQGRILDANRAFTEMSGYGVDELRQLTYQELTPAKWHAMEEEVIRHQVLVDGCSDEYKKEFLRKGGDPCPISVRVWLIKDPETDKPIGLWSLCRDISEQHKAEQALIRSEAKFRRVIDNALTVVVMIDGEGIITFCNPRSEEFLGYKVGELVGNHFTSVIAPEDQPVSMDRFRRRMAGLEVERWFELRFISGNGRIRWGEVTVSLIWNDGETDGIEVFVRDITEWKQAEAELKASEERLRHLVDNATDGFFVHDRDGKIVGVNEHACLSLDYSRDELLSMRLADIDPELTPAHVAEFWDRMSAGATVSIESIHRRKDGSTFPVETRAGVWREGDQQLSLAIVRDMTERKRAEDALRAARNELEQRVQERTRELREANAELHEHQVELAHVVRLSTMGEMAAEMAHELNQPLAAIANYANGCSRRLRGDLEKNQDLIHALGEITSQANRASGMIRRMRNFVRKRPTDHIPTDINRLVRDVVALAELGAKKNGVSIKLDLIRPLPLILADSIQIEQVILNLILNGIEAMHLVDAPHRTLRIRTRELDGEHVEVSVVDVGHGFTQDLVDKIFTPFFTTKEQGLGIGLSISRSIIESHGGSLWPSLNDDQGATFRFTLPIKGGAAQHDAEE